ncbi:transmembrane protein 116-like [Sycon ciliatum]|uniref:transmembrane protein 116-like n=1 Tax=Sycon ciliatum TaxID=27933 RepID=UPI0020A87A8F|eukprot:scpid63936/ scgid15096/ Transmembrane protein 116
MGNGTLDQSSVLQLTDCSGTLVNVSRLNVLAYSRLTASSLSFIGSVSIIIYILKKHKLSSSEIHPLFFLGIADFLLSSVWVVGNALFIHHKDEPCNIVAIIVWCLELLTHLLTVMYALVTWMKVYEMSMTSSSSRERKAAFNQRRFIIQKIAYVLCWILPIALTIPRLTSGIPKSDCLRCVTLWAEDLPENGDEDKWSGITMAQYGSTVFIVVLTVSFTAILVLYGHVRVMIKRVIRGRGVFSSNERAQEKQIQKRALLYICVFFICWLLTLIVTMWTRVKGRRLDVKNNAQFGVLMGQAWTMPMQGFLNCLVYGWSRSNFRNPKNYNALPFREQINNYGSVPGPGSGSSLSSSL